ncbi:MAG: NUDIX domain-containing protein [Acetobacteraceae bacterium]|nr:NUDIX domain-containing protein [Acetobacteraceae bacterium]
MRRESAGLLLYKRAGDSVVVFLVHPGGPFWRNKDDGVWTIPKGLIEAGEDRLAAARREFEEETGIGATGEAVPLGSFRQPGGKLVHVWAIEGDADPARLSSNRFDMEWPPRSGRRAQFPEADRAGWFGLPEARAKLLKGQWPMIEQLCAILGLPTRAVSDRA